MRASSRTPGRAACRARATAASPWRGAASSCSSTTTPRPAPAGSHSCSTPTAIPTSWGSAAVSTPPGISIGRSGSRGSSTGSSVARTVGCLRSAARCAMSSARTCPSAGRSSRRSAGSPDGIGRVGTLPAGCEETELCIRARRGLPPWTIVYEPDAEVRHHVPPQRARARYFLSRCLAEGRSKAAVAALAGAGPALEKLGAALRDARAGRPAWCAMRWTRSVATRPASRGRPRSSSACSSPRLASRQAGSRPRSGRSDCERSRLRRHRRPRRRGLAVGGRRPTGAARRNADPRASASRPAAPAAAQHRCLHRSARRVDALARCGVRAGSYARRHPAPRAGGAGLCDGGGGRDGGGRRLRARAARGGPCSRARAALARGTARAAWDARGCAARDG